MKESNIRYHRLTTLLTKLLIASAHLTNESRHRSTITGPFVATRPHRHRAVGPRKRHHTRNRQRARRLQDYGRIGGPPRKRLGCHEDPRCNQVPCIVADGVALPECQGRALVRRLHLVSQLKVAYENTI